MTDQSHVTLVVPAMPEFLRVARITASGLAGRLGFNLDEVDDLRLALDELCFTIIGEGGPEVELHLRYVLDEAALTIEGSAQGAPARNNVEPSELSRQILTALVDEHRIWSVDGIPQFSLVKHSATERPERPAVGS